MRFNVFLSHRSQDKPVVRRVGIALKKRGLSVWLDEWELVPGRPWQEALEEIIKTTESVAVFVGASGLGPWEDVEMRACLDQFVKRKLPVIPVLLPGAKTQPELPLFLQSFKWVDLRNGIEPDGLDQLVWGITGTQPQHERSDDLPVSPEFGIRVTFSLDQDYSTFDKSQFISKLRVSFDVRLRDVTIVISEGSTLVTLVDSNPTGELNEVIQRIRSEEPISAQFVVAARVLSLNWRVNQEEFEWKPRRVAEQAKVIFPLHGIRTRGEWVQTASNTLALSTVEFGTGWVCRLEGWNYGYYNVFQFLTPWSRSAKVEWFRRQYTKEMDDRQVLVDEAANRYPSIIAHSFGTYILGNALLKYKDIRFNKIILVGSILPRSFPWKALMDRGQVQAIRNEFGIDDHWTQVSSWFVLGTGSSGTNGFLALHFPANDSRFEQEEFLYKHSDYFDRRHIQASWRRFLEKGVCTSDSGTSRDIRMRHVRGDHRWSQLIAACLFIVICSLPLIPAGPLAYRAIIGSDPQLVLTGAEFKEEYLTAQRNGSLATCRLRNGAVLDDASPLRVHVVPEFRPVKPVLRFAGPLDSEHAPSVNVTITFNEAQDLRPFDWIEVSGDGRLSNDLSPQIDNSQIQNQQLHADGCSVFRDLYDEQNKTYAATIISKDNDLTIAPFTWVRWKCRILLYDAIAPSVLYACPVDQSGVNCVEFSVGGGPLFCTEVDASQGAAISEGEIFWILGRIVKFKGQQLVLDQVRLETKVN